MARPKLFGFSEFKITRTPRWLFSGNASQPASHAVQGVFEVDLGAVDEHAVHFHLPCRAFRALKTTRTCILLEMYCTMAGLNSPFTSRIKLASASYALELSSAPRSSPLSGWDTHSPGSAHTPPGCSAPAPRPCSSGSPARS